MRPYKIFQAATLAACLLAGLSGCGGKSATGPEALAERPRAEAVTPAGNHNAAAVPGAANAGAASKAPNADRPAGAVSESGAPSVFPGEADLLPTLKAVTDFCDRPGSLAFMTRDGCRAALSRLSRDVDGQIYFNSLEDCRNFLRERRNSYNDIVDEHSAWCRNTFANLHDRRGCIDAAPVFLGSFTEREFCRTAPSAPAEPGKNAQAPRRFAAPDLENYNEPGRKFDQPRRGRLPAASAPAQTASPSAPSPSAASGKKSVSAPAPALAGTKAASGQAAAPKPAEQTPAEGLPPVPVVQPASPPSAAPSVPASSEATPPATPAPSGEAAPAVPAGQLSPPAPASVPAWPAAVDFSNVPEPPAGQSLGATTGPNAVSPEAVPEAIRATSGGQVGPGQTPPAPPASDTPADELPAPEIGKREPVVPLPPVPAIGQIAPPLVPGVPPDAAISASTLPAPDSALPQTGPTPVGFPTPPDPMDAFGPAIPNLAPPPPPDEEEPRPMPLSGAPAGQAGN